MANIVAVTLEVDAGKSVQNIKDVEKEIRDLRKETTSLNEVNTDFKKELLDLNNTYKKIPKSALSARKAIEVQMEGLKEAIADNNLALKDFTIKKQQKQNLVNDLKAIKTEFRGVSDGILEIGGGVTAGFSAFTGVTAMFGTENEKLVETLVKLESAESTLRGITEIRNVLQKESNAMKTIQIVKLKVVTALQKAYAFALGTGTKALKLFRAGLIATGLGGLVVLLGVIISKWDDWKDSIMTMIKNAFPFFIKALQWLGVLESDLAKERRETHEQYVSNLEEQRELLEQATQDITDKYDHEIALAKASGEDTAEIERQKLIAVQERIEAELQNLNNLKHAKDELSEDEIESFISLQEELIKIKQQAEIFEAQQEKKRRDKSKKAREERKKQAEKEAQETIKRMEDESKLQDDLRKQIEDFAVANIKDAEARKLAELQLAHDREMEQMVTQYGEETELMKELEEKQKREMLELATSIKEEEDSFWEAQDEKEVEEKRVLADKKQAIVDKAKEDEIATEKAVFEAKQNLFNMSANLVGQLGALFEGQEKIQKAFALAQIGIDTARAISSLVAMSNANPLNVPTSGLAGVLQYASGVVGIMSNMKQAYSILKAGSPVSAGSVSTAPRRSTSTTGSNQNINTGDTDFKGMSKVVLVETDVQAMAKKTESIEVVSTF